jgi:hypothetical protein
MTGAYAETAALAGSFSQRFAALGCFFAPYEVQKQYDQVAHRRILPRSRFWQRMRTMLEFAMHSYRGPRLNRALAITLTVREAPTDISDLIRNFVPSESTA